MGAAESSEEAGGAADVSDAPQQPKGRTVAGLVNETCCVADRTFLRFIFTLWIITVLEVRVQPFFVQIQLKSEFLFFQGVRDS